MQGIHVEGGVIDSGYSANVSVLLYNANPQTAFRINRGDIVAQMVLHPLMLAHTQEMTLKYLRFKQGGFRPDATGDKFRGGKGLGFAAK